MAHALIKTFDVGEGDCIFFVMNNGEQRFSIMIDCGYFSEQIENYIVSELENHIDLLIITHIDEDHIIGIKDMLSKNEELIIDRIIFNCAQLTNVQTKDLPPKAEEVLDKLKKSTVNKKRKKTVSARQSLLLSSQILRSKSLKVAWDKQKTYITAASDPVDLGLGFGSLSFVSPDEECVTKLYRAFKKAFVDNFYMKYEGPYTNESSVYELLVQGLSRPMS